MSETNATDAGPAVQEQPTIASTDGIGLGSQHDRRRTDELQRRIEKQSFIDEQKREEAGNAVDAHDLRTHLGEERRSYTVRNQGRMHTAENQANDFFIRAQFLSAKRRATFDSAWQIYDAKHREAFSRLQSIEASSTAIEADAKPELDKCMAQLEESVKNVGKTF